MTKPVTRKMAVDCLLHLAREAGFYFFCPECGEMCVPGQNIQFDHRHAIIHDGPHDFQNLRPVHYDPCHKEKTARDIKANAKVKRLRGEREPKPKRQWPSREIPSRPWPK